MSASRIRAALIDLSGTLHIEDNAIPGAVDALKRLRASGVKVKFVTNTTNESLNCLHSRLTSLGFDINKQEVFTSLTAASRLIKSRQLRPLMMLEEKAKEDFAGISEEDPNAVLIGLAPSCFNYEMMNKAFRLMTNDGAPLIAIHKARYFKQSSGLALGPGAFVAGLEYSTGAVAEVVGKPEASFFHQALDGLDCQPEEAVMIGDDARDDVAGAIKANLKGVLVKTGKYRDGDESKFEPKPDYACADFPAAVQWVIDHS